jgi:5-methylcytosine-specific restriction endonuclease McrA
MGKLRGRGLPNRLARAPSRLRAAPSTEPERNRDRRRTQPWRAWYGSARWRALSWAVRLEAAFTCARCARVEGRKGQTVADHIVPHRGDEALFWDRANLQCLCKPCHDQAKQAEERAG